jgi:hypothetical protein
MIYVFAVALESRINLLSTEVQCIRPVYISIFHEDNVGVITIVLSFKETVVKARVNHESYVIEI